MPEPTNSTALQTVDGEYTIVVSELSSSGGRSNFSVPVPHSMTSRESSLMLQAAILKKTSWADKPFPMVLHAVMYAERMGLDIFAGDVYSVDGGRLATTAGAKIRHAMSKDRIAGYDVEMIKGTPEFIVIPVKTKEGKVDHRVPNLKAKVTVTVKGWEKPVVYETTIEEWYVGTNPNWKARPAYMLRRNALSKALEEIVPMGAEPEEVPPPTAPMSQGEEK